MAPAPDPDRILSAVLPGISLSPAAERLFIAVCVYREAADRNAILFQVGQQDWTTARVPDRRGPTPPLHEPPDLVGLLAECTASGVLTGVTDAAGRAPDRWLVDPAVARVVQQWLPTAGRTTELVAAQLRAAEYWQWRAVAWPQDREADMHDLLEARHHLFSAGRAELASEVTQSICAQLHAWGEFSRETELIQATLERLPDRSLSQASWTHELGAVRQACGDYDEARRCFSASVRMFGTLGDHGGVARGQHSLGVLAQAQGDYRRAERHYRRSAAAADKDAVAWPGDATEAAATGQPGPAAEPAGTAQPVQTVEPVETAQPAQIAQPAQTAQPVQNVKPVETARPVQTQRPVEMAQPGDEQQPDPAPDEPPDGEPDGEVDGEVRHRWLSAIDALVDGTGPVTGQDRPEAEPAPRPSGTDALRRAGRRASWVLRRRWILMFAVVGFGLTALTVAGIGGALARPAGTTAQTSESGEAGVAGAASAARMAAASWVASQVSHSAVIACDPAMCAALQQRGLPAGDLLALGPAGPGDPLDSNVIVATAAVRGEFGSRLGSVYAPLVLASFGAGTARIQVRVIAPDGAAAYRLALQADLAARSRVGSEMLRNGHLVVSATARAQLAAGAVDSRLLVTLATLADTQPLRVVRFLDAGPGAAAAAPLRAASIAPVGRSAATAAARAAWDEAVLRFLEAQQAPFLPSLAELAGPPALLVEYSSPSPLGLLGASGTSPAASP